MKKPFVISISGVSGGGKTTVTNALKDSLKNSVVVSFDDYDDIKLERDINDWSADTNDENEWYVEPLAKTIERLLNEPFDFIIVDYPFGYRNSRVGQYINFAVFVDTPLDIALARRTIRDYTNRAEERN
ncbi:MAG: AAA family ATPase [Eubacteriales bacterium]